MNAIVLHGIGKRFKKQTVRRDHTTLKDEIIRWLKRRRDRIAMAPSTYIEALKGVDLTIPKGKTVGIIGRNGSGKSTLLKIITGIYTPTSGTLEVHGRISALLDLGAGFHPDFSGRENIIINGIILGMSRAEVKSRVDEIIAFSELGDFIDEPVRTYSSGMYMRLAFAVATHVDPEILIIDEILAVGDEHFGKKSMAKMTEFKKSGRTIVLVTHDLGTVQRWCDLAAWIDGGKTRLVGEPGYVVDQYRQAVAVAEAQAEQTGVSALSSPGGSLPELPAPVKPTTGPEASADHRSGNYRLELKRVRLLDAAGRESTVVDSEAGLEVCIEYLAKEPLADVVFAIELKRADGLHLYGTNTTTEGVVLPQPLEGEGRVRLIIDRIGLTSGGYCLDVTARTAGGVTYDMHRGLYPFTVQSAVNDVGVVRPPHHWAVESGTRAKLTPARTG
ncbi:MAG: ABC transporter ATP-binding protein [Myxococcaceae bacterium]